MKKILSFLLFLLAIGWCSAQQHMFNAKVFDGITFVPLKGVSVYNINTKKFVFTDAEGKFEMKLSVNDTLILSKSVYRQQIVVINKKMINNFEDFFLYYKSTMLKEVRVIALNPSFEGFKKDIVTLKLPEYYERAQNIELSEFEKANATYKPNGNLLSLGGQVTMSPITYLYDKYSHKSKMNRLYNEMVSYEEEVERVQDKYNREIVQELTGLKGDDLLNFMMYCRFSYYDLVRWSDEEIRTQIKNKYFNYQYDKIKNEEYR